MMRHGMLKVISMITLGCMVIGLTSCQSNSGKTSSSADNSTDKHISISAMLISWGSEPEKNGRIEKDFEKRTNMDIDATWIPYQSYNDRVNVSLASGDVKDVTQVMASSGDVFYTQVCTAVKQGIFQDLTPYLKGDGFVKSNSIMKNWPQSVWDACTYGGKIYALPRQNIPIASNAGEIVRKDLVEAAGITKEPTTMDELGDDIIKLSKPGDHYGLQFSRPDFDSTDVKAFAVAFTGVQDWGVDKSGNFKFQSFMPEYDNFLKWMKKLYDAKAIDPEFTLNQSDNSDFVKGKSAVKMNTWWNWDQSADGVSKKFFNASVTDSARVWCWKPVKGPKAYATGITAGMQYPILISSKVPKSEMKTLMKDLNHTDDDFQTFLKYGYENDHYTKVDDKYTVNAAQQKLKNKEAIGTWYMLFLMKDPDYVTEKFNNANASQENIQRAKDVRDAANKEYKEDNLTQPQLGLGSQTYQSKWTTLIKDMNDNKAKVVMGKMSMSQWDSYVKGIESSSDYKQILKEFKTAYLAKNKSK